MTADPAGSPQVPTALVPILPDTFPPCEPLPDGGSASLSRFVLAHGKGLPRWSTRVRLAWSALGFHVSFECEDRDIWGTYRGRDEPLWTEEVVEIFLAPGPSSPHRYFEFQFNPFGALFDARVSNPRGDRRDMEVHPGWNSDNLRISNRVENGRWTVDAVLPWRDMIPGTAIPRIWRANFFRIERPLSEPSEYSAWSAPLTDPPDFHRPSRFGVIRLETSPPET